MTEGNWLALIVGVLGFAFSMSLCIALGFLVEPWLGFMVFAVICAGAIIAVLVSYRNAHPGDGS